MVRSVAGQQEAYDNFIEWLLESEAQEAYEEYVGRKQREYGILAEKKKVKRVKPDNRERVVGVSGVEYWKPKVKTQVYPEAKYKPILSNEELRKAKLNQVFPDKEVFFLLINKNLEKYGITNGEVYIKGQVIKKLVSRYRANSANVLSGLRADLHNIILATREKNHTTQEPVLTCYTYNPERTGPSRYGKIIIALDGEHANCVTTYFRLKTQGETNALMSLAAKMGVYFQG